MESEAAIVPQIEAFFKGALSDSGIPGTWGIPGT